MEGNVTCAFSFMVHDFGWGGGGGQFLRGRWGGGEGGMEQVSPQPCVPAFGHHLVIVWLCNCKIGEI